jgi:hypothetical protein
MTIYQNICTWKLVYDWMDGFICQHLWYPWKCDWVDAFILSTSLIPWEAFNTIVIWLVMAGLMTIEFWLFFSHDKIYKSRHSTSYHKINLKISDKMFLIIFYKKIMEFTSYRVSN